MRSGIGAKFLNIVNKDKNNQDDSGNIINERFNEAKVENLYQGLRSVRHTNSDGMGTIPNIGLQEDELSLSDDDESQMSMPKIDDKPFGMSLINESVEGEYSSGDDSSDDEEGARIFGNTTIVKDDSKNDEHGSDFIPERVELNMSAHRQGSDISMHSTSNKKTLYREESDRSTHSNTNETWASSQASLGSSATGGRFLRALGIGQRQESNRSVNHLSTSRRSSNDSDDKTQKSWFGTSFKKKLEDDEHDDGVSDNAANIVIEKEPPRCSATDHHAKSRSNFTKRTVQSITTSNDESFRMLQQRMKEKGAVTANSVRHMLQEAAEEHAVKQEYVEDGDLNSDDDEASINIEEVCLNDDEGETDDRIKSTSRQQHQTSWFNNSVTSFSDNIANKTFLRRKSSEKELQQAEDPMFSCTKASISSSGVHNIQPYITIPSRETSKAEILFDVVRSAADKGESRLLTVHGLKFVGKTRLLQNIIDTGQINGFGYTVLTSTRTSNDALTSFYPFREVISTALRMCDATTQRSDESFNSSDTNKPGEEGEEEETDVSIVRRLIQRKILNKNDQLMIGRILPEVMNGQLLSLLKGRNPVALTKDVCESLFKILIPLQPVMLVFESEGDECDIDPSSSNLIEELLLSAGKQCPQLLCIMISRQSLSDNIPTSISDKHVVDVHIDRMDRHDTECYIRALFCDPNCIDRNTEVDENVVDGIYNRARGCPLFTERLVLWAKRKSLLELDERRNAVALHFPNNTDSNDYDNEAALFLEKLPSSLNEEILEVINNLPDHSLDALKLSACLGLNFDLDMYKSLKDEGLYASLKEIISSVGIFELIDGHNFRWKHVAVYEAVQSIIISNERRELHGQIADSLRNLTNVHNSRYARHSVYAAKYDDGFDRYMSAGDEAEKKSDYLAAVGFYQQAKVCLSKSSTKPSLRRRLSPYAALGWCLRELIRYDEAEMELEYCQSECSKVPEEKRNQRFEEIELDVSTSLATLKQAQSKYSEAIDMYERALPTARANVKKHSKVWLANHVASCAETHRKSGDLEEARTLHREALEYREEAVKEHSCTVLELATSYNQLGCTMSQLGDYDSAYSLHKKALSARAELLDFNSALVSESLNYCADALQALGKGRQGIPLGMHAVKIRHHIFGPHHPAYAHALSVLASCYHSIRRSADALSLLTECLDICEKAFSSNHANLIPNLLLYGKVLIAMGDCDKAKEVYTRALDIHQSNFNEDQNRIQLIKLQDAIEELYSNSEMTTSPTKMSIEMPIPSFEPDSSKTHVIACVDIGTRASDELMLSVAASLEEMGSIKLMSVIAVSPPQVTRSNIARGALDSLMLSGVPVAYSGVVSTPSSIGGRSTAGSSYNDDYGKPSAYVNSTGIDLLTRALLQAPSKSLVILCTACLGDVSEVINTHRELFVDKVKQVVILGSVKPVKRKCFIEPEEGKSKEDSAATYNVYQTCQELGIPTLSLCKDISQGFPFSSSLIDDLTTSNHMVSIRVQHASECHANGIWELIKQYQKESKSYRLPSSKSLDKAFYKYALGGKNPSTDQSTIWPMIKSINLELVLGLLSCIPAYQDSHFRWDSHEVKGVQQKICRHANSAAGIIKPEALSNEIHMLIGFSFRTSLLITSC